MATVTPVTTFQDRPDAWLQYLARVTRWTPGSRAVMSDVVVVGRYDAAARGVRVDTVLKGRVDRLVLPLALPRPPGAGAPAPVAHPEDGDLTLAFLSRDDDGWTVLDAPSALLPAWASMDLTSEIAAAQWFLTLPASGDERADRLAAAVRDDNPAIRTTAIRAIADERVVVSRDALRDVAGDPGSEPKTATWAAVALWLLGDGADAEDALRGLIGRVGRDTFLSLWQVQESEGDAVPTLYAPDPDAWRPQR